LATHDNPVGLDTGWLKRFGEAFQAVGPETRQALIDLLPEEWSFDDKRVLDFGCGPGRTLRHFLPEAERGEFWGADIDAASVENVRRNLCPPMHAMRCEVDPPLGLEHGSFDLVWAISVFSHLTDNSLRWLLELHRLLKPDGLLIATYSGRWHAELVTGEPWDEDRVGMTVLRHNQSWELGGPRVLISDWWMRAHWGRGFEVVEIAPKIHNQSWAVLRKRDIELEIEDLERPENDPREYRAARYNLVLAQQEIELTQAQGASRLSELQREYERSLSWRLTRPLRAASRSVRALIRRRRTAP
jgi:SAM-dependent methyltransferase